MNRLADPPVGGQATDPPAVREPKPRAAAFRLTPEEAQRVRTATRKVANTCGGFVALSVKLGVSTSIVYHAANPKRRPSLAFAVRLAAVAGVPVEVILTGKLAVSPAVIGVAA